MAEQQVVTQEMLEESIAAVRAGESKGGETRLEVLVFTDPYCSWCWATEPMIFAMQEKYREQIHFQYVFGGLIEDMDDFFDADNDIRTAAQVGPHWRMVSERSGQPIDERLWEDLGKIRHFSSWPANIAAKAAFLQGEEIGVRFLRRMRVAAETERKIISLSEVYEALAGEVEGLDVKRLRADIASGAAEHGFVLDQVSCALWKAYGFPTMLFYQSGAQYPNLQKGEAVYVNGHRTMETYDAVIHSLVPDIVVYAPRREEELLGVYGPMTERELSQVRDRKKDLEQRVLERLEGLGKVSRSPRVRGNLWSLPAAQGGC